MSDILKKHRHKLEKKEKRFLEKKENIFVKNKIEPIKESISKKIPTKMISAFQNAFEKGFNTVFSKGTAIIEKSFNNADLKNEYEINQFALSKDIKNIKRIDKQVNKGILINKSVSAAEGLVFGILGIGIPDIPIFIGVILKTIYEISLKYGFDYNNENEHIFILNIISMAVTEDKEKRKYYSQYIDDIGFKIDNNIKIEADEQSVIKETSRILCDGVIGAKMLQGIAVVGVLGGISNFSIISKISRSAVLKYKKRFLNKTCQ